MRICVPFVFMTPSSHHVVQYNYNHMFVCRVSVRVTLVQCDVVLPSRSHSRSLRTIAFELVVLVITIRMFR